MKNRHQRVKHLRRYSLIDILILPIIHFLLPARANASDATLKDIIAKLLDLLLIINPILIVNILSFLILIKTFPLLLSLLEHTYRLVAGRGYAAGDAQVVYAALVDHVLDVLDLDVPAEGHVGHHYSNVFWGYVAVVVEVVPV